MSSELFICDYYLPGAENSNQVVRALGQVNPARRSLFYVERMMFLYLEGLVGRMDQDLWDLTTYHEDTQKAYKLLENALPILKPFREPVEGELNTCQNVLFNLQQFMSQYQFCFSDFVDDYLQWHNSLHDGVSSSARGIAASERPLKRMVQPLFIFSQKLEEGLKNAAIKAEELEESYILAKEERNDEQQELEASLEAVRVASPRATTPASSRLPRSRSSPVKRASQGEEGSEMIKRLRAVDTRSNPARTPLSLVQTMSFQTDKSCTKSPFDRSSFSRTSSSSSTSTATTITPPTSVESSSDALPVIDSPWQPISARNPNKRLIFITPPTPYQARFNRIGVRFHNQWELERLIAQHPSKTWIDFKHSDFDFLAGTASDAAEKLDGLVSMEEAPKAGFLQTPPGTSSTIMDKRARLLKEVDDEEASIMENDLRGVGNDSQFWPYGGKIAYSVVVQPLTDDGTPVQPGTVLLELGKSRSTRSESAEVAKPSRVARHPVDISDNPFRQQDPSKSDNKVRPLPFEMHLRSPEMPGKSFRLARRFGSRRILTFKLKNCQSRHRDQLLDLFRGRILVLFGRPYRALWADGESIHAIETNDTVEGMPRRPDHCEPAMPSFAEVLSMFNHLPKKPGQAMAKWAARPQLLFSDSVPATRVERTAVVVVPDIVTREAKVAGHASTEQTLTDGCGLMSETLARRIYHNPALQLDNGRPPVVQVRVGGSKGLLALMSPVQSMLYDGTEVVLRDSMVKAFPAKAYENDPSLLTIDVLKCESLRIGTALSSEAIIAMTHGGVPSSVFVKMAEEGLEELRNDMLPRPLKGETEAEALLRLTSSIYHRGGIGAERQKRKARLEGRSAQVTGLTMNTKKSAGAIGTANVSDDEGPLSIDPSERFDVDPVTGQPGSIGECLLEAVINGVNPAISQFAAEKLHHLVDMLSGKMVREIKLPVEESLSAFIVPDSLGMLAPDEIFIAFSGKGPVDTITGRSIPCIKGPCLAFRSPCKLPTDVRKFRAVWKAELAHLTDCIVMSASADMCKRSPASLLGGGDYDGDTAQIFWGKELVDPFKNADERFADVPDTFIAHNFNKQVVKGTEFLHALKDADAETVIANMQYWLLGGMLSNDATSDYSNFHGNAVYKLGYDHSETIRLARMFCHVLDARKSGLIIKKEIKASDSKKYGGDLAWRSHKKGTKPGERNVPVIQRGKGFNPFIMDELMAVGIAKQTRLMADFPSEIVPPNQQDYVDLHEPWHRDKELARSWPDGSLEGQLGIIQRHVEICYEIWQSIIHRQVDPKTPLAEVYNLRCSGTTVAPTPGKKRTLGASAQSAKAEKAEFGVDRLGQMRQLALIWKEKPERKSIPILSGRGERYLRELKVSCAAEVPKRQARTKQKFPFDVDFTTTCAMKAEKSGKLVATCLRIVQDDMKPRNTYKEVGRFGQ